MGLFRKRVRLDEMNQARVPLFGSGRRLRSERTLTDCLTNLEACIFSYRPPESAYRSAYVFPGWRWHGLQEKSPETVISFNDSNDDFLLAAFWPDRSGTECVLFPLGSGDERLLSLPIIDHWHYRDPSLRSVGVIPEEQIALAPPHLPDQFFDGILKIAGFPSTPYNLETLGIEIGKMFLTKSHQFIAAYDPGSADRFIQSHRYNGGPLQKFCQSVLNDLAAWNPDILPYMQDTPMRVRAIVLEIADAPMWGQLERLSQSPTPSQDKAPISDPDSIHDSPEVWVEAAIAHSQGTRFAEALAAADHALALDPNHVNAWFARSNALASLGSEEAVIAYDHALLLDPNNALGWINKGNVLYALERHEEALVAYEHALALDPNHAGVWYVKGLVLADLRRYEEALTAYDRALALDLSDVYVLFNKGNALYKLGRNKEALVTYDHVLELDPNGLGGTGALGMKGVVLILLERYEEALAVYDRVLVLDPNQAAAWSGKGVTLRALGRVAEAAAAERRARELGG